jgi:hypothetical protein
VDGKQPRWNAMSRRAGATGQSDSSRPHRSGHTPGPMALVWIAIARGVILEGAATRDVPAPLLVRLRSGAATSGPDDLSSPHCRWSPGCRV